MSHLCIYVQAFRSEQTLYGHEHVRYGAMNPSILLNVRTFMKEKFKRQLASIASKLLQLFRKKSLISAMTICFQIPLQYFLPLLELEKFRAKFILKDPFPKQEKICSQNSMWIILSFWTIPVSFTKLCAKKPQMWLHNIHTKYWPISYAYSIRPVRPFVYCQT